MTDDRGQTATHSRDASLGVREGEANSHSSHYSPLLVSHRPAHHKMSSSATTSPVSLVDMPELPLKHILSHVGFRSLQSLRLVSKPLCQFIETKKLSVPIDNLCVRVTQDSVVINLRSCGLKSHLRIYKHEEGAEICSGDNTRCYEGMDYRDYSLNLLKYVLNTPTTHTFKILEYSDNGKSNFCKMFEKFLTQQKIILKVCEFSLEGNENQAIQLLPFLDSSILKELDFTWTKGNKSKKDGLMKLEQWKKAKILISEDEKIFRVPIQHFGHFEISRFNMLNITAKDLLYLKEKYTQSPVFSRANICCERSVSPDVAYGEPVCRGSEEGAGKWIFRCSDPNYELIIYYGDDSYSYSREHISNTTLSSS
ncbi:unnamed protein product [Caenorhabditis brenneri]